MSDAPPPAEPAPPAPAAPQQQWTYVPQPPYNVFAIIALVGAFVVSPLGIIFGHMSLAQIKRTGERGRELGLTGMILGYVFTGLWVLYFLFVIVFAIILPLVLVGASGGFITGLFAVI